MKISKLHYFCLNFASTASCLQDIDASGLTIDKCHDEPTVTNSRPSGRHDPLSLSFSIAFVFLGSKLSPNKRRPRRAQSHDGYPSPLRVESAPRPRPLADHGWWDRLYNQDAAVLFLAFLSATLPRHFYSSGSRLFTNRYSICTKKWGRGYNGYLGIL